MPTRVAEQSDWWIGPNARDETRNAFTSKGRRETSVKSAPMRRRSRKPRKASSSATGKTATLPRTRQAIQGTWAAPSAATSSRRPSPRAAASGPCSAAQTTDAIAPINVAAQEKETRIGPQQRLQIHRGRRAAATLKGTNTFAPGATSPAINATAAIARKGIREAAL